MSLLPLPDAVDKSLIHLSCWLRDRWKAAGAPHKNIRFIESDITIPQRQVCFSAILRKNEAGHVLKKEHIPRK
jgi:hypothetical protein